MKTVALCNRLGRAISFHQQLSSIPGVELILLIAPTGLLRRHLAALGRDFVRLGPNGWSRACRLFFAGRLKIMTRPLADERSISALRALDADVGLHASPVIYRASVIDCFGLGILNAHIGLLPKYRGRSVMEWSILNGDPTGITTFFIDEGIDTGSRIVVRREVAVTGFTDTQAAKRYLFALDGEMYANALKLLQEPAFATMHQRVEDGTRWYAISNLLTEVVNRVLAD